MKEVGPRLELEPQRKGRHRQPVVNERAVCRSHSKQRKVKQDGFGTRRGDAKETPLRVLTESAQISLSGGSAVTFAGELRDEFPVARGFLNSIGQSVAEKLFQAWGSSLAG